ncbi:MAG: transposase [Chlorobi bacterium]|nr:transposase [Chlorobiota bacterium]
MKGNELKIFRRHLPHWTLEGSVYFVTFTCLAIKLSIKEQKLLLEHIKGGDNKFYILYAVIVMPTHVHLLLKPNESYSLSRIMKGIKGVTAHQINQLRNTSGSIWLEESYDRIVRDYDEFMEKLAYMFNNPIKSGFTEDTENYHGWYLNEEALKY